MSWKSPAKRSDVELLPLEPELLAEGDRDPLHALRVARGVRILGVDRGVQALDRVERALLEQAVGLDEPQRTGAELLVLAAQGARRAAHEERERRPEDQEHDADGEPEHRAARADQPAQRLRVRVDLVRADCACPALILDGRVDLEQVAWWASSLRSNASSPWAPPVPTSVATARFSWIAS